MMFLLQQMVRNFTLLFANYYTYTHKNYHKKKDP